MGAKIIKLPNYMPDKFLQRLQQAQAASIAHEQCMIDMGLDGPYNEVDIAHERGYQEALMLAQYLYRRRYEHQ